MTTPTPRRLLVAPLARILIRRSVAYWVLLHLAKAIVLAIMPAGPGPPLDPATLLPGHNPFLVLVVLAAGMIEARRRNEDLFLVNLGFGPASVAAYLMLPAAALESAATVAHALFGG